MAYVLTYSGLLTLVQRYLERNDADLIDSIPTFIMLAQFRIQEECKVLLLKSIFQDVLTPGVPVLTKPSVELNLSTVFIGTGSNLTLFKRLLYVSYGYARVYAPNAEELKEPKNISEYDSNHWLITPTPDQAYPIEAAVMTQLIPLDESNQTNVITQKAPHLLIFATLAEAIPYVKNDERLQIFEMKYKQAAQSYILEDKYRITDAAQDREKS